MATLSSASLSKAMATLRIDDREVTVATEKLASQSDFFRVLFFGDFAERNSEVFRISDDNSRALLTALRVETDPRPWQWAPSSVSDGFDIYLIADKYWLPNARKACSDYLSLERPLGVMTELIKGADDWQQFDLVKSILRGFTFASAVASLLSLDLSERSRELVRQRAEAFGHKIFLGVHGSHWSPKEKLIFSLTPTALSEDFAHVVCGNMSAVNIRGSCYKFMGEWNARAHEGHTPCPNKEGWFLHSDGDSIFEITQDTTRTTGHYFGELLPEEGDTPKECQGPVDGYSHACRRGFARDL